MNDNNIKLTLLQSNTTANSKYDPPSSNYAPLSSSKIVQHFCSGSTQSLDKILMVIGGLLIVYGIVAK
jgi:hypothetical protein